MGSGTILCVIRHCYRYAIPFCVKGPLLKDFLSNVFSSLITKQETKERFDLTEKWEKEKKNLTEEYKKMMSKLQEDLEDTKKNMQKERDLMVGILFRGQG